jgi:hypothetical protein
MIVCNIRNTVMDFFNQITRVKRIDYLIRTRSTGTPSELASKLSISTSQVYQIIRQIKIRFEVPIYYSREYQSYCYRGNFKFLLEFRKLDEPQE